LIKEAFEKAPAVIEEVAREFSKISGRQQTGLFEEYRCNDAEVVLVAAGASSGDAMDAADALREGGVRAGVLRLKTVRPFPGRTIRERIGSVKALALVDRDYSYGFGGILGGELASFLGNRVYRYIAGIGGRDITIEDFQGMMRDALSKAERGDEPSEVWWGLKEVP